MKIKIEQSHIDEANENRHLALIEWCPIGIRLTQLGLLDVKVHNGGVEFLDVKTGSLRTFDIPEEVREFIEDFDLEFEVKPFEFEIPLEMEDVERARGKGPQQTH